jgi:hypothetical protein
MLLARENIRPQALPSEEHSVPELGGSVLVQGMDMAQLLAFTSARRRLTTPKGDETAAQAAERASGELLALLLHHCVLAADQQPVYSPAQWAAFGAAHPDAALRLWDVATRLSGQHADHEKKA